MYLGFRKACRQCFLERGLTVLLKEDPVTGDWLCPRDMNHKTKEDDIIVS